MNLLKIVKDMQPLIIGLLILWVFLQKNSSDSFIEDRNNEFKQFSDSLDIVNGWLLKENESKGKRIDTLIIINDSLEIRVASLDEFIATKTREHEKDRNNVGALNNESTVSLLSDNLSKGNNP